MSDKTIKITALTVAQMAKLLSNSAQKKITEDDIRQIAANAGLLRADDTINLLEYTAFLAGEV